MSTSRTPLSLRELQAIPGAAGVLASNCLRYTARLRDMCFLDNEHGHERHADVANIVLKVTDAINGALKRAGKHVRVDLISVDSQRHHHIRVNYSTWTAEERTPQPHSLTANLWERSKRTEDETEERVKPRRGEVSAKAKATRPRRKTRAMDIH